MKLQELLNTLDQIAPLRLAESWDNVGLLAGDPGRDVTRAMLSIDFTAAVAQETYATGCDLVIAYHPVIFEPIKQIVAPNLVFEAISRGVSIYCPHTALDVADGGTNDVLGDVLGLTSRRALRQAAAAPWHYKLIVYIPTEQVESVCTAMFQAGAGWIGNYSHCSFRSEGTGTFLGHEGTSPAIGEPGKLERVKEQRVETIVPAGKLSTVVAAMIKAHPYEEPAFDIIQLITPPDGKGMGRIGSMPKISRLELLEQIKLKLGVQNVLVAGPLDGEVTTAACCAGACGSLINDAIAQRADLLLTGEVRHHDALKAAAAGMTVVCALHSNSERLTLRRLAQRLSESAPQVDFLVSKADHDPFAIV